MKPVSRRSFLGAIGFVPAALVAHSEGVKKSTKLVRRTTSGPILGGYALSGNSCFIATVTLQQIAASSLTSISFSITPKSGSTTTPISATYTKANLMSRGLLNSTDGTVALPIFGLYASPTTNTNMVVITVLNGSTAVTLPLAITTNVWGDDGGLYTDPTVTTPRDNAIALGFSYFMMKEWCLGRSPVVVDTDGEVRWYGTQSGSATMTSSFFENGFYLGLGSQLWRNELDGSTVFVRDYSGVPVNNVGVVTSIQHHNIDPGKNGLLLEVITSEYTESTILEVDTAGNVLETFSLPEIISAAMLAGQDDPTAFIPGAFSGADWFHNNAACYWPEQDVVVISSRENFVIAIDYSTKAIKWILGDVQKQWYQFASLRAFALTPTPGTVTPIGQHAVSVVNNELMLFDDGYQSFGHNPAGNTRGFSVCRKYAIDPVALTASETWTFNHVPPIWSSICSSVYQVGDSYLVDYANAGGGPIVVGLGTENQIGFEYQFRGPFSAGWNALPIDISNVEYS